MKSTSIALFLGILITLTMISCNDQETNLLDNNENMVTKEDRPRFSPVACVRIDEYGNYIAAGTRCRKQNGGGCRRITACGAVPKTISDMIETLAGGTSADLIEGLELNGNYDIMLALYNYDPDLYEHPDSLD